MEYTIVGFPRIGEFRQLKRATESYWKGEITKEEMQTMKRKYDSQTEALYQRQKEAALRQQENRDLKALRATIQSEVSGILKGETESEVF